MRARMLLIPLAGGVLIGLLFAIGDHDQPDATKPTQKPREMAGRGYLPEDAPRDAPPAPKPRKGAQAIDFDTLSAFDYDPEADLIPAEVRALDGKLVELRGVMYYAIEDPDKVEDFFLMPNHMICCFGTPRLNEAVEVVQKKGRSTQYVLNYYLVRGKLAVGPVRDEQGNTLCLYRITNAEVESLE